MNRIRKSIVEYMAIIRRSVNIKSAAYRWAITLALLIAAFIIVICFEYDQRNDPIRDFGDQIVQ